MLITSHIRSMCHRVADLSQKVQIDHVALEEYARQLPIDTIRKPTIDQTAHYMSDPAGTLAFFITLNAINFGSGYFPFLNKIAGKSGYYTVAIHLTRQFQKFGPWSASQLNDLTPQQCHAIFNQPLPTGDNEPAAELMSHFARALNDLGRILLTHFQGQFKNLIDSANHSAVALINVLAQMPYFQDVQPYNNLEVPFYKRAQITSADLSIALDGKDSGRFDDLDQLTIFADNLVPHVLRVDGVLKYHPDLAAHIDAEKLIEKNSPEEIEIRANAVHAVELMVQQLRHSQTPVTAGQLDYLLWHKGGQPYYKNIKPRHRARTVYY